MAVQSAEKLAESTEKLTPVDKSNMAEPKQEKCDECTFSWMQPF